MPIRATWLDERSAPRAPAVAIAEAYEVDAGCQVAGGAGLAPVLLAFALLRRSRARA